MVNVFAGLTAFNGLINAAKALAQMNNESVRLQASIDLQRDIFTAQQEYSTLLQQVGELKEKVASFEKWETEKERYDLKSLGWGALAYMLKPAERGTTPPHIVCTKCYGDGRASPIQNTFVKGEGRRLLCPACKTPVSPDSSVYHPDLPKWLD